MEKSIGALFSLLIPLKLCAMGRRFTDQQKLHISEISKKVISQYTKTGIFLKKYSSATDAAKELFFKNSSELTRCAKGKSKSAYGFIWRYEL